LIDGPITMIVILHLEHFKSPLHGVDMIIDLFQFGSCFSRIINRSMLLQIVFYIILLTLCLITFLFHLIKLLCFTLLDQQRQT